jgi:hypothetical protein
MLGTYNSPALSGEPLFGVRFGPEANLSLGLAVHEQIDRSFRIDSSDLQKVTLTAEKEEAARKMAKEGRPIAEIARVLDVTRQTVYRALGKWERKE